MKNGWWGILCLLLTLSSCFPSENKQGTEETAITIQINNPSRIVFSDLFEQVEYLPLETTDSALIGIPERFRIFDDKLCIVCDKSVLMFDKQTGKAGQTISRLGHAPGDYQSLYDVYFDRQSNVVELLDMNSKKVHRYALDGQYINSITLPFMAFSFTKKGDNEYWFYNNNMVSEQTKSKIVHFDAAQGKIIKEYFPIDTHLANFFFVMEGNNLEEDEEGLLFFSCPPDTIYRLNEKSEPTAAYTLDFGTHTVPQGFFQRDFADIMEFSTEANKQEYVYFVNNFTANQQHLLLSFLCGNTCFWNIYNRQKGTNHTGCLLKDDLNALPELSINHAYTLSTLDDDRLYFLISAEQFLTLAEGNAKLTKLIKERKIDEQSNPVLVKCKFK